MFTREDILRGSKLGAEVMRQKGHDYFVNLNKQSYEARKKAGKIKGFFWDKDGYKIIYINGRKIREHRYIIEQSIGRKLLPTEQVHHIDGNIKNNDIKNLLLTDCHQHNPKFHPVSEKTRRLLSSQRKGVPKSPEHRAKMVEYLKVARASRKKIDWSRMYRKCIKCGETKNRHKAHGLCTKCYSLEVWNNGLAK